MRNTALQTHLAIHLVKVVLSVNCSADIVLKHVFRPNVALWPVLFLSNFPLRCSTLDFSGASLSNFSRLLSFVASPFSASNSLLK